MKVECYGINDRHVEKFRMRYITQTVPQYCETRRYGKPLRIMVNPAHLMFLSKGRVFKKTVPIFIFSMLDRKSQGLEWFTDEDGKTWGYLGHSMESRDSGGIDPKAVNTLDYLVQPAFWTGLKGQFQLSKMTVLILMAAGAGVWLMVESILRMF